MTAPRASLDHVTVLADTLAQGVDHVRDALGVTVPRGGRHQRMGTHNAIAQAGPDRFLEILANDPDAERPERPRWFGLDGPDMREAVAKSPLLAAWVIRTPDIEASLDAGRRAGLNLGSAMEMTRGDLKWLISIRDDGILPEGGTLPVLIEWPGRAHPSSQMGQVGLALSTVTLRHPQPDQLAHWLEAVNARHLVEIDPRSSTAVGIQVAFQGPNGSCQLSSLGPLVQ